MPVDYPKPPYPSQKQPMPGSTAKWILGRLWRMADPQLDPERKLELERTMNRPSEAH
jgi:hypothetical protein